MISGSIKNVELMDLVTNAVQFSVKVLNGRSVRILKFVVKESETKEERHCSLSQNQHKTDDGKLNSYAFQHEDSSLPVCYAEWMGDVSKFRQSLLPISSRLSSPKQPGFLNSEYETLRSLEIGVPVSRHGVTSH